MRFTTTSAWFAFPLAVALTLPACQTKVTDSGEIQASMTPIPTLILDANSARLRGEFGLALGLYDIILEREETNWEANYYAGLCYMELGDPFVAERLFREAYAQRDNHAETADVLDSVAASLIAQERFDVLRVDLDNACSRYNGSRDFIRKASSLSAMGDPDGAKVAYERAEQRAWEEDRAASMKPGMRNVVTSRYRTYRAISEFYGRIGAFDTAREYARYAYTLRPTLREAQARLRELGIVPGPTQEVVLRDPRTVD